MPNKFTIRAMSNKPDFKQLQIDFAAHIRHPAEVPAPIGIENRRLVIYRKLFINSLSNLIASTFPVLHSLYSNNDWQQLIRDFFQPELNKTPHFPEIPREFLAFIQSKTLTAGDKPFLQELALYEWLELHLDKHLQKIDFIAKNSNDLNNQIPVINPISSLNAFNYPVHQISIDFQPQHPLEQAVFLLLWRDQTNQVRFTELNAISAMLWENLKNNPNNKSGQEILNEIAIKTQSSDMTGFIEFGLQSLNRWQRQGIICDTRNQS